mgnify:FL=1|jgi:hypothetical protein
MIDTSEYEGHDNSWYVIHHESVRKDEVRVKGNNEIADEHVCYLDYHPLYKDVQARNAKLIAAAPDLLAEVKRLNRFVHCAMNFMSKHDLDYQFLNQHGVFTPPGGGAMSVFTPYSYKWDDETKVSSEPIKFTVRGEEE